VVILYRLSGSATAGCIHVQCRPPARVCSRCNASKRVQADCASLWQHRCAVSVSNVIELPTCRACITLRVEKGRDRHGVGVGRCRNAKGTAHVRCSTVSDFLVRMSKSSTCIACCGGIRGINASAHLNSPTARGKTNLTSSSLHHSFCNLTYLQELWMQHLSHRMCGSLPVAATPQPKSTLCVGDSEVDRGSNQRLVVMYTVA
jgi:hypothetical protein